MDQSTGVNYIVSYIMSDAHTIELRMSLKTPSRPSNIEFEVIKLSSDIFKGSPLDTAPRTLSDAQEIPVEPRMFRTRALLLNKGHIIVRGTLCNIEVKDLMGGDTLYVADGRNMPWDKYKSIVLGAMSKGLAPGRWIEFKYAIKVLPPSRTVPTPSIPVILHSSKWNNPFYFFNTQPKEATRMPGTFRLDPLDVICGSPSGTAEKVLSKGIEQITSLDISLRDTAYTNKKGIFIEKIARKTRFGIPYDGFEIDIRPDRVTVRGANERGCLYGAYALLSRLVCKDGVWQIPCARIRDWPDLPMRGGCLELYPTVLRDVEVMKRYLDAYSRARCNTIIFLHHPKHLRAWTLHKDDGRWTKEQMIEIARYARWLHMDVWGGVGSKFNKKSFPEMDISEGTNIYNPFNEKNYEYLFSLYDEVLKTYSPSRLLICHDEIKGLSVYAQKTGKDTAEILAMDVRRIHDWLKTRQIQTVMSSDMLLDHETWEAKVGSANSRNPFYQSGATHLAQRQLPRDILILDWHYNERKKYESIEYFRGIGFNVAGASWHDPKAAQLLVGSVKHFGGQGIFAHDFGFWHTMSPAATTLYALICGWSSHCSIEDYSDVSALADAVRDPIYTNIKLNQVPVSIKEAANRSTHAIPGKASTGIFDAGSFFDLQMLKSGRIMLGSIRFDIASADQGRSNNAVVVGNSTDMIKSLPNTLTLYKGTWTARRIAFLHTAFIEEPVSSVRRLGSYRIEYENGVTETIDLLENWNITDIRSSEGIRLNDWTFLRAPDILLGAKRVWQGNSASGIPLNLQLFLWNNPHPEEKIRSIKLSVENEPKVTRIVLLGLTFMQ